MRPSRGAWALLALLLALVSGTSALAEQGGPAQGRGAARSADVPDPAEVNRLFDAYAIMQAQEMLQLDDSKFGSFVTRLKALQEVRRRSLRGRGQVIQDLQRLLRQPDPPDEALLKDRLDALARQDTSAAVEIRKATDAVDELLDVRQRARFRVFEHQLELKKLELLARVRQQIRANRVRP
jgi:hypothetical protein